MNGQFIVINAHAKSDSIEHETGGLIKPETLPKDFDDWNLKATLEYILPIMSSCGYSLTTTIDIEGNDLLLVFERRN